MSGITADKVAIGRPSRSRTSGSTTSLALRTTSHKIVNFRIMDRAASQEGRIASGGELINYCKDEISEKCYN